MRLGDPGVSAFYLEVTARGEAAGDAGPQMGPVFSDCVDLASLKRCSLREILGDLVSRGQGQEQDLDRGHVWSSFPVLM